MLNVQFQINLQPGKVWKLDQQYLLNKLQKLPSDVQQLPLEVALDIRSTNGTFMMLHIDHVQVPQSAAWSCQPETSFTKLTRVKCLTGEPIVFGLKTKITEKNGVTDSGLNKLSLQDPSSIIDGQHTFFEVYPGKTISQFVPPCPKITRFCDKTVGILELTKNHGSARDFYVRYPRLIIRIVIATPQMKPDLLETIKTRRNVILSSHQYYRSTNSDNDSLDASSVPSSSSSISHRHSYLRHRRQIVNNDNKINEKLQEYMPTFNFILTSLKQKSTDGKSCDKDWEACNSEVCIPKSLWCDNIFNCPQWQDEGGHCTPSSLYPDLLGPDGRPLQDTSKSAFELRKEQEQLEAEAERLAAQKLHLSILASLGLLLLIVTSTCIKDGHTTPHSRRVQQRLNHVLSTGDIIQINDDQLKMDYNKPRRPIFTLSNSSLTQDIQCSKSTSVMSSPQNRSNWIATNNYNKKASEELTTPTTTTTNYPHNIQHESTNQRTYHLHNTTKHLCRMKKSDTYVSMPDVNGHHDNDLSSILYKPTNYHHTIRSINTNNIVPKITLPLTSNNTFGGITACPASCTSTKDYRPPQAKRPRIINPLLSSNTIPTTSSNIIINSTNKLYRPTTHLHNENNFKNNIVSHITSTAINCSSSSSSSDTSNSSSPLCCSGSEHSQTLSHSSCHHLHHHHHHQHHHTLHPHFQHIHSHHHMICPSIEIQNVLLPSDDKSSRNRQIYNLNDCPNNMLTYSENTSIVGNIHTNLERYKYHQDSSNNSNNDDEEEEEGDDEGGGNLREDPIRTHRLVSADHAENEEETLSKSYSKESSGSLKDDETDILQLIRPLHLKPIDLKTLSFRIMNQSRLLFINQNLTQDDQQALAVVIQVKNSPFHLTHLQFIKITTHKILYPPKMGNNLQIGLDEQNASETSADLIYEYEA
ncbi:Neuropilin and tolloid protein 2 [Schistosoma japonicum]|nr:Neuropilin and tolloid protein 2 [Schistosoma japonicum]